MNNLGCYRPRRIPHRDFGDCMQSITYRLADAISPGEMQRIVNISQLQPTEQQEIYKRRLIEDWLHANRHGICILSNPVAARIVIDSWYYYNGKQYDLFDWVVMRNHVHLIIRVYENVQLGRIIGHWKSYTGRLISNYFSIQPPIWEKGYWDRIIRDDNHYHKCRAYIINNPIKAGLDNWPYVSTKWHKE